MAPMLLLDVLNALYEEEDADAATGATGDGDSADEDS